MPFFEGDTTERTWTSKRSNIVQALAKKLKTINGQGAFLSDVGDNVSPRLLFWDEVDEFPAIHLNAGSETRRYQTAGIKDRFLTVTVRCYVNEEDAQEALNKLMEDVETVLEENSRLARHGNMFRTQIVSFFNWDDPILLGESYIKQLTQP